MTSPKLPKGHLHLAASERWHKKTCGGTKRIHECPDWDFMLICEACPEFECCTCYPANVDDP